MKVSEESKHLGRFLIRNFKITKSLSRAEKHFDNSSRDIKPH